MLVEKLIKDKFYKFSEDVLSNCDTREGYFQLAKTIYGLKFDRWYDSGYWDGKFIPYVLYDGDTAVSSVAVAINEVTWQNTNKCYVQISTVMTLPEYRNKGLSRWLMEYTLNEWKDKCDAVYLLANDSVVNFYPKFGFEEFTEYDFTVPVQKVKGEFKKLDINNADDLKLIIRKYQMSNPFTELKVKNFSQFMFHCLQFQFDNIYYLEQFDAVAIASYDGNMMTCYDVFTDVDCELSEILGVLANENTEFAYLGFTPKVCGNCLIEETKEEDYHLFVLSEKENIFKDNRIIFPLLSRA